MTIRELAEISGVKEASVKRNIQKIAGIAIDDEGNAIIPAGSRYPYDAHRFKFDTTGKRRVALLEATYHVRYIDHISLHMSAESFQAMIKDLLYAGYLQINGSNNKFGANQYDTTLKYDKIRSMTQFSKIKSIADAIASSTGHLIGAFASELSSV